MIEDLNSALAGFVELHREGRVLEIRMVKPKVNAICRRLSRAMERAALFLQESDDLQVGVLTSGQREVPSDHVGELVMSELRQLDPVAYVRFASVYRSFEDLREFVQAIDEFRRADETDDPG